MFKNFEHFSLSVIKENVGYKCFNSLNAVSEKQTGQTQKKQSDLGLPCLSRPFWLANSVRNFQTITVFYFCSVAIHCSTIYIKLNVLVFQLLTVFILKF